MYRKESEGWFKHTDFILIDMICLQIAFYLAYLINGLGINPYNDLVYRNMAIVLELADLVTMFMLDMLHHVAQRGRYRELIATVGNVVAVGLLGSAYLFVMQEGAAYSRMTFGITLVLYFILSYTTRLAWKRVLASGKWDRNRRSLLIVTTKAEAKEVVETVKLNNYGKFLISGLVIVDKDMAGQSIAGVNVIANSKDAPMYVCQQWIDEVLIVVPDDKPYPEELIKKLEETGVTMHLRLSKIAAVEDRPQFVEKIGSYTVLTTSLNYASPKQLLFKRVMDIAGGLVGCLLTVIIFIFVAPVIYISSPGPIFFSQERIGKNGKKFKIYKFRSMYMDAEARKAELMKQNRVADGKMFKLDFDPHGIAKNALRDLTQMLCKQKNIVFQWLRGYYIVGNSKFGSSIFSKITAAVDEGKTEFPFTLGQNQYDFIDYPDFCAQVAAVVGQKNEQGIINICSGKPEKLADRVERFIKENGYRIKLQYGAFPDRPYDSKAIWGNDTKIRKIMENQTN